MATKDVFEIHVGMPVVMVANDRYNFTGKTGTVVPSKISRIGRKWIYVQPDGKGEDKEQRFSRDEFVHYNGGYSPSFYLFRTEDEWNIESERRRKILVISDLFRFPRESLGSETVNEIWSILERDGALS